MCARRADFGDQSIVVTFSATGCGLKALQPGACIDRTALTRGRRSYVYTNWLATFLNLAGKRVSARVGYPRESWQERVLTLRNLSRGETFTAIWVRTMWPAIRFLLRRHLICSIYSRSQAVS